MFLKSAKILFGDLPNLQTILSRIQEIPASAQTVERMTQMAENAIAKQNSGLQETVTFSIALDESKDVNYVARVAVIARYCDKDRIYEELCSIISLSCTTKE
ncbi:uncharacterized protein TNCV_3983081 [Trichonephila clavipes]|nr:uncharacterized protein TNCV_3983081 [Trichonephila clavipes]